MQKFVEILLKFDKILTKFYAFLTPPRRGRSAQCVPLRRCAVNAQALTVGLSMPRLRWPLLVLVLLVLQLVLGWIEADFRVQIRIF